MKKIRISFVIISLLLVCTMAVNLTGCTMEVQAKDLMEGITPNNVNALDDLSSQNADVTDFAIRLFKASNENGKNTLVSPLSVLCALAMTANGAEEETLAQMEEVLGMTTEELNMYLYSYMKNLPQGDTYKLSLANSIWFTEDERFTVNQDFLQTNANYYDADRITRKQVGQGDEVTLTYTAYIFNGRAPAIEDVYDTNDVLTLEQLRMAGLNSQYWSVDPLTVKIGGGDIIKGLELSLVGCREGDVVEAYITSDDAYGKDVVGIVPEKTPVAWFYTIESVGAAQ